ncbi:winged helix DNA-binding domain-containing protein [Deinococcus alpinitundrae]|uniref:winged helix DNA-binding domain-containing protein n=1 Tax=Deinococcus alpinitundrae TaxID=468913 RepID=UPI001ED91E00|nr:crosslink repair DNA glycosylase YcaQ family protein [Deinococcus alpinitundrae]
MPIKTGSVTTAQLRAAALGTLKAQPDVQTALNEMGFVQADPIRAPARAQDLTLMQRVPGYRAGDLERHYLALDVEEDMLPNYGFVSRAVYRLLHPRAQPELKIERDAPGLGEQVLAYAQAHGEVHPRTLEQVFGKIRVGNAWGGSSNAATRSLEGLHRRGLLRVVRREKGVKVYGPAQTHAGQSGSDLPSTHAPLSAQERADGIVRLLVRLYGPLPRTSLGYLLSLSGYGAPGLQAELRGALAELAGGWLETAEVDGQTYFWSAEDNLEVGPVSSVRIVGPFDPLVWDRRRFVHLHGWTYKFEAYTPPAKRLMGYYALPLFWNEKAVGWANLNVEQGRLVSDLGFVPGVRQTVKLRKGIEAELERYRRFLQLEE